MSHLPFDTRLHVSPSLKRSSLITPSIIKLNVPYKLPSNTLLYWDDLFCLSPQFSCEFLESTDWIRFVSVFRAWLEELISWDLQALESSLAEVLRTCFSSSGEGKANLPLGHLKIAQIVQAENSLPITGLCDHYINYYINYVTCT